MAAQEATACLVCGTPLEGAETIIAPDHRGIAPPGDYTVLICPSCGGGTTSPLVSPEELAPYYEAEEYGPHVSGGGAMDRLFGLAMSNRVRFARLFGELRRVAPGRALDVGCGRGDLAVALKKHGWQVAGLDASARACEAARARGIDAREATIESLDAESAYEAIVFHHSLEHVTDPVESLRAARRAVKPGGLVMIGVPNFASRRARKSGFDSWLLELPRHRFHFTPEAMQRTLDAAGLETHALRENAAVLDTIANLQQRSIGHNLESGPAFLAGYALTVVAFPFAWASNQVRGGGELLNAIAARPQS